MEKRKNTIFSEQIARISYSRCNLSVETFLEVSNTFSYIPKSSKADQKLSHRR